MFVSEHELYERDIKEKTCRRGSYLLNLKLCSKTEDGKSFTNVHRVISNIECKTIWKKLIQAPAVFGVPIPFISPSTAFAFGSGSFFMMTKQP